MLAMYPLLQATTTPITASDLAVEYAGFLAYFGVFGALGFRWLVLSRTRVHPPVAAAVDDLSATSAVTTPAPTPLESAEVGAARVGLIGALFMLLNLVMSLYGSAAAHGVSFASSLTAGGGKTIAAFVFVLVFLLSFAAALRRVRAAWLIAALAGIAYALQSIVSGKWTSLVNPLHETAASLWLGTLFVLVIVGLPAILRSALTTEQRGSLVASLVGAFSPVAIGAALLLAVTGVTTAWRHLKYVAALWTTPYGYTLDVKLGIVAIVVALGAWNWRRMRPRLGLEAAAHELRRSARAELFFAALVLVVTGILVSLPAPRLPHP